jgi:hypothetical protein
VLAESQSRRMSGGFLTEILDNGNNERKKKPKYNNLKSILNRIWRCNIIIYHFCQNVNGVISIRLNNLNLAIYPIEICFEKLNSAGIYAIVFLNQILYPYNTFAEEIIDFIKLSINPTVFLNYFIRLIKVILKHGNLI